MIETPEQKELIQALYDQNFKALYTYAKNAIDNGDLALEAVQETFVIACSKPKALIGHPNPPGWLMQKLKYVLKNMARGRADLVALLSSCGADLGSDCPELGMVEMDIDCSRLVGEDNWRLYKAVTLKRMTVLEAAEEIGISREAAKKRIQRTCRTLARETKYFI